MKFLNSGILLLDKAEGPTSAHVVARAKRILGARRVGHLGTLDPFASGLLPLGINEGTKIAQTFLDADKRYTGTMILGAETDSQDRTGSLLHHATVPKLAAGDLVALRRTFTGRSEQIPPMFSALKHKGVRLYELARKGKAVPREPRSIVIQRLDLWLNSPEEIGFAVTCSKGTYIRTLVADMGKELGCGAYLDSLRRVGCGPFDIASAVTLEELDACNDGSVPLISLNKALAHLPTVVFEAPAVSRLRAGQQAELSVIKEPEDSATTLRIIDQNQEIAALIEWHEARGVWKLVRVFSTCGGC